MNKRERSTSNGKRHTMGTVSGVLCHLASEGFGGFVAGFFMVHTTRALSSLVLSQKSGVEAHTIRALPDTLLTSYRSGMRNTTEYADVIGAPVHLVGFQADLI